MVSRQQAAHTAANTPSTSSTKPTGWIRSSSASKPVPSGVLSDRTNLPSASKHTPLRSLSKPLVQNSTKRIPVTNGAKQQKLSSFFAPHTDPAAAPPPPTARLASVYQDSPSLARAQRGGSHADRSGSGTVALDDDELEARAANLLRGRFGSVSRSLNASRSSTPTRVPSEPCSDPQPSRTERQLAPRAALLPSPAKRVRATPIPAQTTPPRSRPRPAQVEHQQPEQEKHQLSSPPFEPTLMQQSLSEFTQPAWERACSSKMALFQRLAGVPKEAILEAEKRRMAAEVEKAHRRMQAQSPPPLRTKGMARRKMRSPSKDKIKAAAALASPPKSAVTRPQAVLRSPRTNRRIYALETQYDAQPMGGNRSVSVQPLGVAHEDAGACSRRAVSEASHADAAGGPSTPQRDEMEDESETLPLPWGEAQERDAAAGQDEQTQVLPWDPEEGDSQPQPRPPPIDDQRQRQPITEVPTSDDEDLLLQQVVSSSSSSPSPSPSPHRPILPSSCSSISIHATTSSPLKKRRRVEPAAETSPTLLRTPLQTQRLPRVSPISLTPSFTPLGGPNRFDRVVAALKKEERRQNTGMQLNLSSFLTQAKTAPTADGDARERESRRGLGEDLEDVLSDDDEDTTVTGILPSAEEVGDETQPLPWSSQTQPEPQPAVRPGVLPFQPSSPATPTQRTACSSASSTSSAAISLPSESNLQEAGNTQLRSFFEHL